MTGQQRKDSTMAKIYIRENATQCNVGDYYRDSYKRYHKCTQKNAWSYGPSFENAPDPTANLPRVEGTGGFNRETLVLCRVEDMRSGCARTGSYPNAAEALSMAKSGTVSVAPLGSFYGGPHRVYGNHYGFCRPGDVMAFDSETTVTTLSYKRGDKLTADVKHGQSFVLDSGEMVYVFKKPGAKLPTPARGWFMKSTILPPSGVYEMWQVGSLGKDTHTHQAGYDAVLLTVPPPAETIEGIARLAAAEKEAQVKAQEADEAGTFILWSPESSLPVTKQYAGRKQATAVAVKMAEANPGQKFIVAKLVEEFTAEKPVAPTLKRAKLA